MKAIVTWCRANPTRVSALAAVVVGWVGLVVPEEVTAGLATLVGVFTGTVVWGAVTPVKKP